MSTIKVSIVEDDETTRQSLFQLIRGTPGFAVLGAHATAETALRRIPQEKPDVVLLDLELPQMWGVEFIQRVKTALPKQEIVVLTVHDDPALIFSALEAGATGYLVKPAPYAQILDALAEAHAGGSPMSSQIARLVIRTFHDRGESKRQIEELTPREEEILVLVTKGYSTKEVAAELAISPRTVATHLHHVYEKLQVPSRSAAAAKVLGA